MPEHCGSTTVSASIVASAASAALPPARRISTPGLGGARIGGGDHAGLSGAGRGLRGGGRAAGGEQGEGEEEGSEHQRGFSVPTASVKRAKPCGEQPLELAADFRGQPRPPIDQRGVELDEARAGADPVEGVDPILDPAGRDQRQRAAGRRAEIAQPLRAPAPSAARRTGRRPRRDAAIAAAAG